MTPQQAAPSETPATSRSSTHGRGATPPCPRVLLIPTSPLGGRPCGMLRRRRRRASSQRSTSCGCERDPNEGVDVRTLRCGAHRRTLSIQHAAAPVAGVFS